MTGDEGKLLDKKLLHLICTVCEQMALGVIDATKKAHCPCCNVKGSMSVVSETVSEPMILGVIDGKNIVG